MDAFGEGKFMQMDMVECAQYTNVRHSTTVTTNNTGNTWNKQLFL